MPLITINHGRTDSTDGRVFPYVFPLLLNPYSETSGIVNYIASKEGGLDKLKGKKIVVLYHGSPYGKETIPIYELLTGQYGFERAADRSAASRQRAAGAVADHPPDQARLCGPARLGRDEPGGSEDRAEDRLPGRSHHRQRLVELGRGRDPRRRRRQGYTAITTQASGAEYPVLQEIVKTVYDSGKGNLEDKKRIGSVYHNLGIVNGILNVEAIRIAQEKFGKRTLTGDEVRWGFEHLQLDARSASKELGAKGLFHSINVTWDNHEGDGRVTFQQWDGSKWNVVCDWIAPDWALLRPIIEKSAEAYAKEKGLKMRTPRATWTSPN